MKTYKIISLKKQHIYSEGELIRKITTDNILKMFGVDELSELYCVIVVGWWFRVSYPNSLTNKLW